VAVVTGASVGIGAAISKNLVKHGMTVVGLARNKEAIEKLAEECKGLGYRGKLIAHKCDVSKEAEIEEVFKWVESNVGGVDVCVNNAGFATKETLLELTADQMRAMLDVNVVGLTLCASKAANSMLARKVDGHIININSMSGHRLTGRFNFYAATKFAVTAITEGLRRELVEQSDIRVTQISPGFVETEFAPRAFGEEEGRAIYASKKHILQAQDIAEAVLFALSAPPSAQVHDILIRPTGEKL